MISIITFEILEYLEDKQIDKQDIISFQGVVHTSRLTEVVQR